MRVVAMIQVYNEERFLAGCLEHLRDQGIHVYLIDNDSTDRTLDIAERYLGDPVMGIETLPRRGCHDQRAVCQRKEQLAADLDADWLIHHDADEIRISPDRHESLAAAITRADAAGYNAINFLEFTFVPTREHADHDHPDFRQTMRWYYPVLPGFPNRLNAFKRQDGPVNLTYWAGHCVLFPGLRMAPESLYMRHYLFLSRQHAVEKYVNKDYDQDAVERGWHGWRAQLRAEMIELPSESQLRESTADYDLDPSEPRITDLLEDVVERFRSCSAADSTATAGPPPSLRPTTDLL